MELNYKRFGSGSPLFILHGLMGMLDNWQSLGNLFSRNGFEVILVDQRNHGHSPHHHELSYEVMMDDLAELIDNLDFEEVNLLGHSMGGKTVMQYAQVYPDMVNKLIVADIAPKAYPVHHNLIIKGLRNVPLDTLQKRTEADNYLSEYIPERGVRQFLMKSLYWKEKNKLDWRFNLDAIERNIEIIGNSTDTQTYDGETLFLRGENSNYITDDDHSDIKSLFPNSNIKTIEDAGHWLHAEKPKDFASLVLDFIKK